MSQPQRPLFREHAVQQYLRKREKDILPHIITPPTFICCWLLLCLFVVACLFAWWVRIPTFATGEGVVLAPQVPSAVTTAVVFLPIDSPQQVHAGQQLQVDIGIASGPTVPGTITHIDSQMLSPLDAQKRYNLVCNTLQNLTQPSVVVTLAFASPLSAHIFAGSQVKAQIQIGSRRILALLPGFSQWIGD